MRTVTLEGYLAFMFFFNFSCFIFLFFKRNASSFFLSNFSLAGISVRVFNCRCTLGATANGSGHDLTWDWPDFGLPVRGARPDAHWRPIEASSVVARHEEAAALDAARSWLESPTAGEADPRHAEIIIRDAGAENVKTISTPATKETGREMEEERRRDWNRRRLSAKLGSKTDDVDKEDALSEDEVTRYKRVAARANFLAQDRMDVAYAAKEAVANDGAHDRRLEQSP